MCVSEELVGRFPLPTIACHSGLLDDNFRGLLDIYYAQQVPTMISYMYPTQPTLTPAYRQWTSNALLHVSWAMQGSPDKLDSVDIPWATRLRDPIPLSAKCKPQLLPYILYHPWQTY